MTKLFLIDVNLPYYFSLWNSDEFIHVKDLNDEWSDEQIWEYALQNHLTIISKDSDFSNKIILKQPPPKVIHIRLGNMKMKQFFEKINMLWSDILLLNQSHKLANVFSNRIEGVS